MKRLRLPVALVTAAMVIGGTATPAFAAPWAPSDDPLEVCFVPQGFNEVALAAAVAAVKDWDRPIDGLTVSIGTCPPGAKVVPLLAAGDSPVKGRLGFTSWSMSGDYMTSASITIYSPDVENWGQRWGSVSNGWRWVMCHEMGHALGLPHQEDETSCLREITSNPVPFTPSAVDIQFLESNYSVGTASFEPSRPTPKPEAAPAPPRILHSEAKGKSLWKRVLMKMFGWN